MKTYQDWLKVAGQSEDKRMDFIYSAIQEHKSSDIFRLAQIGSDYYAGKNTTIKRYEKIMYNAKGQAIPDYISSNNKIATRFFFRDVTQANAVLLGNGITWMDGAGGEALGADFDRKVIDAGRYAQIQGQAFGFYNNGSVDIFKLTEFKPLYDEEDGALKCGFRFWQIDENKPIRVTAYELDGYTEYRFDGGIGEVIQPKRAYIIEKLVSEADGEEIFDYNNYPSFPIVPCFANDLKQSELVPIRATIDAIDLIQSGYANDIDDNAVFWLVSNAGGMDDVDLVQMVDKLRKLHAAQVDDDQTIVPHNVETPYNGREAILDRLEKSLYKDAMALNPEAISNGAVTATQIEAAYEPLNQKLDIFEAQITDFIKRLLVVAGVDDEPTYTRSIMVNRTEEIASVVNSALYLDEEYITEKVMTLLGDKDKVQDVLDKIAEQNVSRMTSGVANADTEEETI